jgi:LysM repeat protein
MVELGLGFERRPRRASPNPVSPATRLRGNYGCANPGRDSKLGVDACGNPQSRAVPKVEMSTSMGESSTHTHRAHAAANSPSRIAHFPPSRSSHFLAPVGHVAILAAVVVVIAASAPVVAKRPKPAGSRHSPVRKLPPYWVVRPGDTFTEISQKTGLTVAQLQAYNPDADPLALYPGQRLLLWAHPPGSAGIRNVLPIIEVSGSAREAIARVERSTLRSRARPNA